MPAEDQIDAALDAALTRAIELAAASRAAGDHPFGAVLLRDGAVVAEAVNRVNTDSDLTAHAELMLVRQLESAGRLHELADGVVVASTEPCPMCVGAMFWAGARRVVFGLSAERLNELARGDGDVVGFTITAGELGSRAVPVLRIEGPRHEAQAEAVHAGFWS